MVIGFLIATLVIFVLNIILNLLTLGIYISNGESTKVSQAAVSIFIYLLLVTWNILAIIYY